ncbi:ParB N-terminal domain-containing protein [Streptomyces sp. NBC_01320]|uniref:ParB N-terminal domain-containing protein n=1 Tax=Streptomyces sp. NBC_01320 TaxID=2903824 RepID=UPI002E0D43EE|nr:ParB N-terminal domain-containing protein [Streptomyces sp. NBC_01320]
MADDNSEPHPAHAGSGDLDDLKASITAVGLLHLVVVTQTHDLIAGERRLAAVRELGWSDVPVTVVDRPRDW